MSSVADNARPGTGRPTEEPESPAAGLEGALSPGQ